MARLDDPPWDRERMHPWWKQAAEIAQRNRGFVAVRAQSPEFKEWLRYFREDLHWTPRFMTEAAGTNRDVTLPSQWPPSHAEA